MAEAALFLNIAILAAVTATALALMSPPARRSRVWRAMTTPLASIIGSGFLVLGPILDMAYGAYAPLVMAALCGGAYLFGAAIRRNIGAIEASGGDRGRLVERLETVASCLLAFAYVVSVAYYLNLFGAFGVSLTSVADAPHARMLTTAIYVFILYVGWTRGSRALERFERISVTAKIAIIAGLAVGLAAYFGDKAGTGGLVANVPAITGWPALTLAFGLIVTVQGFETSRYLGEGYDARERIRSMRWAQWVSTAIYMSYILLLAYVFERGELRLSETAVVDMMGVVAPVLPALLVAAALAAQFSAAVADAGGSGGLVAEATGGRVSPRQGYAILAAIGLALTWSADVFQIISYASRAFAAYYAIQAAIAALTAWRADRRAQAAGFAGLALFGAAIVVFAEAVEG